MSSEPSGSLYDMLRQRILEGRHAPGERLVEQRLAGEFGVSRTPVRETLARLQAEGLVEIYPNRGAVVRAFTPQHLRDTYGLRAVLEGHGAHQAALRIGAAELEALERECEALETAADRAFPARRDEVEFLVRHNRVYHQTIIAASGNQRLMDLVQQVSDVPLHYRSFYWYTPEERRLSNFFHRRIVGALRDRDAERAGALMREHVYFGRDAHLQRMDRGETFHTSHAEGT
jgi:DNA-binding GntR family transcriptional regulator